MIHLYINGQALDMPEKYSINCSMLNPATESAVFERAFSTNISIDLTSRNIEILDIQTRFDVPFKAKKYDAQMSIMGMPWKSGKVILKGHNYKTAKIYFVSDKTEIEDSLKDKKLREIVNDTFTIPGPTQHIYRIELEPSIVAHDATITIGENVFSFSFPFGTTDVQRNLDMVQEINTVYPGRASVDTNPPFQVLRIDLTGLLFPKVSFDSSTFLFTSHLAPLQHSAFLLDMWRLYFQSSPEIPDPRWKAPVIYNPQFYGESPGENYSRYTDSNKEMGYVNDHVEGAHTGGGLSFREKEGPNSPLCPQILNNHVIDMIASYLNLSPSGEYFDTDFNQLLIYNNKSIDFIQTNNPIPYLSGQTITIPDPDGPALTNSYRYQFAISDMIPDFSVIDYLESLLREINLFILIDGGQLQFLRKIDILNSPPRNWTSRMQYDSYSVTFNEKEGYRVSYEKREFDSYTKENATVEVIEGDGGNEIELTSHPVYDDTVFRWLGYAPPLSWKVARMNGKGNSEYRVGEGNDLKELRLYKYHGLLSTSTGPNDPPHPYPAAFFDDEDQQGNQLGTMIGDLSNSPFSIFERYHKKWLDFLNTSKPISFSLAPLLSDVFELDWREPLRKFDHQNGSFTMLIERYDFTVTECGVTSAKVKGRIL